MPWRLREPHGQLIQGGFDLTDADTVAMKCKYLDDEGDLCTLNKLTLAHWIQQHPNGPLKIQVSLATLKEAARHIEREASMQDATAPNDVKGKSMGTVEVVDWTRHAYGHCPRNRKHTRRRGTTIGQTPHSPTAHHEAKSMGPVINRTNNSGGLVRNTVSEYDGPKLGNEVKAEIHEVRCDKIKVDQVADFSGTMDVERPGPVISCINNSGGFMQSVMPEVDSPKLGNEVKAAIHEVRRGKVEVEQLADLPGTVEVERPGPVISCINNSGGFMQSAMPEVDSPKLGNEVKAAIHEVRRGKVEVEQLADFPGTVEVERPRPVISCINNSGGFMQSAMPEVDSHKLGNEVKAAIHEVRRDKTEANQSAGLSGRMEIGHRRNRGITAGATAGRPQKH